MSLNYYDQANQLKAIRAFDEDAAWLNYTSIQQTLRRLDKAFSAFFRRVKAGETPGYPRFKGRQRCNTVEYRWGDGVHFKAKRVHIQNVGAVKVKWHRQIPAEATIKCLYLKRQGPHWYAVFALELPDAECAPHSGPVADTRKGAVGLDLGLNGLVALSDGTTIEAPRHFRAAECQLAEAQRLLSRRVMFSGRWKKQAVEEYGRRPARLKAGYAVVLSLLLVVLGLVFLFSRPSPRREDAARQEAKGGMGQERRGAETEAQAVGEKLVRSTASLGAKGVGVSDGEGQGPGSPPQRKSSGRVDRLKGTAKTGAGGSRTGTQEGVRSRISPEPSPNEPTSAAGEEGRFRGKEKNLGTGGRPSSDERRRRVPQAPEVTPGGSDREEPAKNGEGIESGRVIDWLLEKGSEKR